jgi:hypothetical protein
VVASTIAQTAIIESAKFAKGGDFVTSGPMPILVGGRLGAFFIPYFYAEE